MAYQLDSTDSLAIEILLQMKWNCTHCGKDLAFDALPRKRWISLADVQNPILYFVCNACGLKEKRQKKSGTPKMKRNHSKN